MGNGLSKDELIEVITYPFSDRSNSFLNFSVLLLSKVCNFCVFSDNLWKAFYLTSF
jgi:hypothetical protein